MHCRDFERLINEQFDARQAASPELELRLQEHASDCAACRALAMRYQTLRAAIAMLAPPQAPSDLTARVLAQLESAGAATEAQPQHRILKFSRAFWPAAAAAAVLLAVWMVGRVRTALPSRPPARAAGTETLSVALAEATAATWDLARATSAPAAEVGLEVLGTAALPETAAGVPVPVDVAVGPAAEMLGEVGQRVNENVRPLSGTARHAFSFLLGPAQPGDAGGG
jgi:hypothetical protein